MLSKKRRKKKYISYTKIYIYVKGGRRGGRRWRFSIKKDDNNKQKTKNKKIRPVVFVLIIIMYNTLSKWGLQNS